MLFQVSLIFWHLTIIPHLPCYMSSFNMHQWVLLCVTQQCMLMQDEVMLSLSNTVVLTTSNYTMRLELQFVVPSDYDNVKAAGTNISACRWSQRKWWLRSVKRSCKWGMNWRNSILILSNEKERCLSSSLSPKRLKCFTSAKRNVLHKVIKYNLISVHNVVT